MLPRRVATILVSFFIFCLQTVLSTDLDDYVWLEDSSYGYNYMGSEHDLHGRNLHGDHTWTGYVLNMTSQTWMTDDDFAETSSAKSLWWHYLVVIVPDEIKFKRNATMWITGGNQGMGVPSGSDEDIVIAASLSMGMGVIVGALFQIPNERMTFANDPAQMSRTEGAILAYGWDQYLQDPSQPKWIVELAMTKAAVRSMDAVTDFLTNQLPELNCDPESYIVMGGSKRGWATWLTAAVDASRVKAIVPIVLDAINFVAVEHHHYRSYGGWSYAMVDYYDNHITERYDSPNMTLLQQNIDPYFYRDRLTMPKLVVNAVLDEFQQPDDTNYWWADMPGPKHFLMTPNADHSELTGLLEVIPAVGTWCTYLLKQQEESESIRAAYTVPEFTWEISETTGEIVATLDDVGVVYEASMWYGYSCGNNYEEVHVGNTTLTKRIQRRDFRLASLDHPCHCGIYAEDEGYCVNMRSFWTQVMLKPDSDAPDGKRVYRAHMDAPTDGRYVAYFIDVKYQDAEGESADMAKEREFRWDETVNKLRERREKLKDHASLFPMPRDDPGHLEFTTQVSVWPNSFPYGDCYMDTCRGYLL